MLPILNLPVKDFNLTGSTETQTILVNGLNVTRIYPYRHLEDSVPLAQVDTVDGKTIHSEVPYEDLIRSIIQGAQQPRQSGILVPQPGVPGQLPPLRQ